MPNLFIKMFIAGILFLTALPTFATAKEHTTFRIGVLAIRGEENATLRWAPTVKYLNDNLPEYTFELVPLNIDKLFLSARNGHINFAMVNAGHHISLEKEMGAASLATLCRRTKKTSACRFGAVIIARADNPDITSINDLKGRSFAAVHPNAFGGYLMARRELSNHGIDTNYNLSELMFSGLPQDRVVYAVRDGMADAGTVRTGILETLASEGKIRLDDYRVLTTQNTPSPKDFELKITTALYPEWSFSSLGDVAHEDAKKIAQALYNIPPDHLAAQLGQYTSWTAPLNYKPARDLMLSMSKKVSRQDSNTPALFTMAMIGALLLIAMIVWEFFRYRSLKSQKNLYDQTISDLDVEVRQRQIAETRSNRFERIIEGSKSEIFIIDADTHIIQHANKGALRHLAYERDELVGQPYQLFIDGLSDETLKKSVAPLILDPSQSTTIEVVMRPKDAPTYPGTCHIQYMTEDNKASLVFIIYDLTERKNAERALRRNERSLQNAQRIANLGHWDWDIAGDKLHWSDQIYRIFGLTPREFEATYEAFLERVHPEDRGKVTNAVNTALDVNGPPYKIIHRVVQPSGTIRVVEEQGEITRDADGKPTWMTGIVVDITEKVKTEARLKELDRPQ